MGARVCLQCPVVQPWIFCPGLQHAGHVAFRVDGDMNQPWALMHMIGPEPVNLHDLALPWQSADHSCLHFNSSTQLSLGGGSGGGLGELEGGESEEAAAAVTGWSPQGTSSSGSHSSNRRAPRSIPHDRLTQKPMGTTEFDGYAS